MDVIRSHLFEHGLINGSTLGKLLEMEKIAQCDFLLTVLSRSGVEGLQKFKKALRETSSGHIGHRDILKKLKENVGFQRLRKS